MAVSTELPPAQIVVGLALTLTVALVTVMVVEEEALQGACPIE